MSIHRRQISRRSILAGAAALGLTSTLAACGGSDDDDSGESSGPVKLTYWSWAPNMEKVAAIWNKKNPDITVTVSKQASGGEIVSKLITAKKAGNAPDLIQVEYQSLPTLVSNDVLADITKYAGDTKSDFADGPVGHGHPRHRRALRDPAGRRAADVLLPRGPLQEARTDRPEDLDGVRRDRPRRQEGRPGRLPDHVLRQRPRPVRGPRPAGRRQVVERRLGAASGPSASTTPATKQVTEFWGGLVQEGVIDNQPMYTPAWNNALNKGTHLAWVSAVWAPGVLVSSAPDTKGKWRMAPLPQWKSGENVTGSWGGSSTGVSTDSKHAEAAAKFATWLNTDPEALAALVK